MAAKNIKVLLLEDDTAHAEAIRRALKDARYKIRVTGTLREYYDNLAADPPDIALLDMFLPDGGAMEVLSSHQQANHFPLLIMTSQGNEQHAVDAMKAGALDYIVKSPEAFADMPGIITHAIDHWKLLQERKWGEEALRRSENKFRNVVEKANDVIVIIQDGIISFSNPRITAMLGYEAGKMEGMEFISFIPPENLGLARERYHKRMAGEKLSEIHETELLHKSGRKIPVETSGSVIEYAGKPADLVIIRDITGRKQAQEALQEEQWRLRSIIEGTNIGTWEWNVQTGETVFNERWAYIIGYTLDELSPISIKTWESLVHPDDQKQSDELLERHFSGELPYYNCECRMKHKDGHWVWVLDRGQVITRTADGKPLMMFGTHSDITARKRSEEALKESEEKFRAVVETIPMAIYLSVGVEQISEYISPTMVKLFGYTMEDIPTVAQWWPLAYPDETYRRQIAEEWAVRINHAIETQSSIEPMETVVTCKNGSKKNILWGYITMGDKNYAFGLDLTDRKQAEEALRLSEARYRFAMGQLPGTVWTTDRSLVFTLSQGAGLSALGLQPDQVVGMSLFEFFGTNDPDHAAIASHIRAIGGEEVTYEDEHQGAFFQTHLIPLYGTGEQPVGVAGIAFDITERKQAEVALHDSDEKYRMVVENALEAILIAVDGMIIFTNNRTAVLTGYAQEELTSRPFTEFIHPDDRGMVIDRHLRRMKGEDIPNIYSFRIVDKAGNNKWVELSAVLITWEGKPAILNFLTDVTDRKRLEEERQRVDKLESVGLLAGGIAHDFNNILTSILGNISLAKMDAAPGSELKNSLEQAEKASQRAKALTVQLLTFAKGGAPVLKLAPLTELLKDTAGFALSGSKVKCRFSIPAGLWHAEIDAGQVSQVIHNLVINAQQAMPTGGSIEISAENMALSETQSLGRGLPLAVGDYVRISVADHGCGIPVENLEKIFDPFFTTKQKGNGMGLAVSFSIARQHGGHLSVESEPGTGSTFFLYLPASTQTAVPEQATEGTVKPAGNIRILVMDDEQGVREIAGRLLKHIGYKDIEFAEDGAEAIKLYKAAMKSGNPFTVAILDLTIAGGMGGEIAIQKLLKIDPGIKAIVSSGYIDDPVIAKFKDHGFSGVMGKPYTIEELRKALQDVI